MKLLMKRIIISTVIVLTIGQSFFFSVASAVQPWTGNPWTGDTWTGDSWEGKTWTGDSWEGESWEGDGTTGDGTSGDGTTGDGTGGDGTTGDGTGGDGTTGDGTSGDGTTGDGTSGDGTTGDGTSGEGTTGDGTGGDGTTGDGTGGNGTTGDGTGGNGTTGDGTGGDVTSGNGPSFTGPDGFEVFNYVAKDVILGQVSLAGDSLTSSSGEMGRGSAFFLSGVLLNGLKLGIDSPILEGISDANDAAANGFTAAQSINTIQSARTASQAATVGGAVGGAATAGSAAMGALGKLNVVAAVGGTVLGGIDTYQKTFGEGGAIDTFNDSSVSGADKTVAVTDATASLGSTLMSAGVVAAAIPGGQAIGAGIVVAGAALWGASKLTGYVAKNWGSIKGAASKAGDAISKGWNSFTGLFS